MGFRNESVRARFPPARAPRAVQAGRRLRRAVGYVTTRGGFVSPAETPLPAALVAPHLPVNPGAGGGGLSWEQTEPLPSSFHATRQKNLQTTAAFGSQGWLGTQATIANVSSPPSIPFPILQHLGVPLFCPLLPSQRVPQ